MVTAAQAAAQGTTRLDLSRLTAAGQLVRLAHGVYRDAGAPADEHESLRAAWLSTDPSSSAEERLGDLAGGVVIAGASAASLHGVGDLPAERHEFSVAVRRQSQRAEIRYRRRRLDPGDVTIVHGLPVTTIEQTIADLVEARIDLSLVADALRDATRHRRLDLGHLEELLGPLSARHGFRKGDGRALLDHLMGVVGLDTASLAKEISSSEVLGDLVAANRLASLDLEAVVRSMPSEASIVAGDEQPYTCGYRVDFDTYIGAQRKGSIRIDLSTGAGLTAEATVMAPANALDLPGWWRSTTGSIQWSIRPPTRSVRPYSSTAVTSRRRGACRTARRSAASSRQLSWLRRSSIRRWPAGLAGRPGAMPTAPGFRLGSAVFHGPDTGRAGGMARAVWKGVVSFGLVAVPVRAFSAVRDHDVHFHQIEKRTGARVRIRKVSEDSGKEVEADDIVMGFETGKGEHVTFDSDELDELRPESTRAVEVTDFVALDEIDPIYYQRTYWLAPDGETSVQPYQLLRAAMEDRELAAIGTVVMRNKQYLSAVRPLEGALAMSTMRFADEVVHRKDVEGVPDRRTKPDEKMLRMATQLIDSLTTDWKPDRYHDTFTEELRSRIKAKEKGEEVTTEPETEQKHDVVDLMQALEDSVKKAKSGRSKARKSTKARKSA